MNHYEFLTLLLAPPLMAWYESGENPALFCYLIGWGTFMSLRSRALAPITRFFEE